jgi:hypothetical protein
MFEIKDLEWSEPEKGTGNMICDNSLAMIFLLSNKGWWFCSISPKFPSEKYNLTKNHKTKKEAIDWCDEHWRSILMQFLRETK